MSNKAIIALLVCLCSIVFSTLLLLKKDVRKSNFSRKTSLPFEVQSASAQSLMLGGKYLLANNIFQGVYHHFHDNPAFVEHYALSLSYAGELKEALRILDKASDEFPLHKGIKLQKAKTLILNMQSSRAYAELTELPLFSHKEAEYLSLIILTTPNTSAIDSLMKKMLTVPNFKFLFTEELLKCSPNLKLIKKYFDNNG